MAIGEQIEPSVLIVRESGTHHGLLRCAGIYGGVLKQDFEAIRLNGRIDIRRQIVSKFSEIMRVFSAVISRIAAKETADVLELGTVHGSPGFDNGWRGFQLFQFSAQTGVLEFKPVNLVFAVPLGGQFSLRSRLAQSSDFHG